MTTSKEELRDYLRSRRARLRPTDVGLPDTGESRRVPGLRREEIALLAGVSVDYYTRLEQGRTRNVSSSVLDAVARALQLDEAEREHLRDLAKPRSSRTPRVRLQRIRPALRTLVDGLSHQPAFVMGRYMDVLSANTLLSALMPGLLDDPRNQKNIARYIFLDDTAQAVHADWDAVAEETAAMLRLLAGRHRSDPKLAQLVGDLSMGSGQFATLWSAHDVRYREFGTKTYLNPVVGAVTVNYEALVLPGDEDARLCIYSAEPASASDEALRLLASLVVSPLPATGSREHREN
jgi:transcriptional regulator with XRE-family HTH domain